jgi:hypothetical protein
LSHAARATHRIVPKFAAVVGKIPEATVIEFHRRDDGLLQLRSFGVRVHPFQPVEGGAVLRGVVLVCESDRRLVRSTKNLRQGHCRRYLGGYIKLIESFSFCC